MHGESHEHPRVATCGGAVRASSSPRAQRPGSHLSTTTSRLTSSQGICAATCDDKTLHCCSTLSAHSRGGRKVQRMKLLLNISIICTNGARSHQTAARSGCQDITGSLLEGVCHHLSPAGLRFVLAGDFQYQPWEAPIAPCLARCCCVVGAWPCPNAARRQESSQAGARLGGSSGATAFFSRVIC